jgi:hypothetical protein
MQVDGFVNPGETEFPGGNKGKADEVFYHDL